MASTGSSATGRTRSSPISDGRWKTRRSRRSSSTAAVPQFAPEPGPVAGHRWAPQPGALGRPARFGPRARHVRTCALTGLETASASSSSPNWARSPSSPRGCKVVAMRGTGATSEAVRACLQMSSGGRTGQALRTLTGSVGRNSVRPPGPCRTRAGWSLWTSRRRGGRWTAAARVSRRTGPRRLSSSQTPRTSCRSPETSTASTASDGRLVCQSGSFAFRP